MTHIFRYNGYVYSIDTSTDFYARRDDTDITSLTEITKHDWLWAAHRALKIQLENVAALIGAIYAQDS